MMKNTNPLAMLHPVILPVARCARALQGRAKVAALQRKARTALACSARWSGVRLGPLQKDAQGAPRPCNGAYWSLSHKSTFVAAVTAAWPVGIDIERRRAVTPALYRRLADAAEWRLAPQVDETSFLRYWTAKEAVLKAVGRGLAGLTDCRIAAVLDQNHLQVTYRAASWIVVQHPVDEDHLVAVTLSGQDLAWHLPPVKGPRQCT